jgi:hypothetical protein
MASETHGPVEPAGKTKREDLILALGILAAVLPISSFLVLGRGETATALGVLWGWIVEVAVWVYVFVSSI